MNILRLSYTLKISIAYIDVYFYMYISTKKINVLCNRFVIQSFSKCGDAVSEECRALWERQLSGNAQKTYPDALRTFAVTLHFQVQRMIMFVRLL